MANARDIYINLICSCCSGPAVKSADYIDRRVSDGHKEFFCSRKCADERHSEAMKGEGNPNYNGEWNAPCPSTWSEDKRKEASKKTSETMIREGTSKGSKNGRWAGGFKDQNCVICGKVSKYRPYVARLIQQGLRDPCCSNECALKLSRRRRKFEYTSIEIKMKGELDRLGVHNVPQYNLGDKFLLDFYLPEYNAAIECDGDYWHNLPEVRKRDKSKNAYIRACGIDLYRFWENEINSDIYACVNEVVTKYERKEVE